jgi:hypothetical protein
MWTTLIGHSDISNVLFVRIWEIQGNTILDEKMPKVLAK